MKIPVPVHSTLQDWAWPTLGTLSWPRLGAEQDGFPGEGEKDEDRGADKGRLDGYWEGQKNQEKGRPGRLPGKGNKNQWGKRKTKCLPQVLTGFPLVSKNC